MALILALQLYDGYLRVKKIIKYMLEKIYHYSGTINSWSWSKLYKNRKEGYGYEEE